MSKTKMRADRLLKLAEFLETSVPKERFDMSDWATSNRDEATINPKTLELECKTAACAGGWACTIPEFQKAGLKMVGEGGSLYPRYQEHEGFCAIMEFFGIVEECNSDGYISEDAIVTQIFDSDAYQDGAPVGVTVNPTPKQVAKRIRKIVAQYEKELEKGK